MGGGERVATIEEDPGDAANANLTVEVGAPVLCCCSLKKVVAGRAGTRESGNAGGCPLSLSLVA